MESKRCPVALVAADAAPRTKPSNYPEPFASRMAGRVKRALGDRFGLTNFGVNLTRLAPGAVSALRRRSVPAASVAHAASCCLGRTARIETTILRAGRNT